MKKKIIFAVIIVILISAGAFFYAEKDSLNIIGGNANQNSEVESSSSSSAVAGIGYVSEGEGDVKIEPLDIEKNQNKISEPVPDLDRKIKITVDLGEEAERVAINKIKELSASLKKDGGNLQNWLVLGVYYKIIGDYEGAREVWEYVGAISPYNSVSFNNLGDLYAYFLKDAKKAEENFSIAIKNGPNQIYIYRSFFDFYRFVFKDMTKAKAVLEQGIAANPGEASLDLQNLLKNY